MNEKWYDECSIVAYPHQVKFLNIDGGSISYYVDIHISDYINKLQNKMQNINEKNYEKDIKNMILQSKIDKANELLNELELQPAYLDCKYYELDGFNKLKDILKEDK